MSQIFSQPHKTFRKFLVDASTYKTGSAQVAAARMAQNTQETEPLVCEKFLIFIKKCDIRCDVTISVQSFSEPCNFAEGVFDLHTPSGKLRSRKNRYLHSGDFGLVFYRKTFETRVLRKSLVFVFLKNFGCLKSAGGILNFFLC